jgi:Zn-dependent peptidase ImmA (M78 family)/transcriptional regulator with XRE-family HTH domain
MSVNPEMLVVARESRGLTQTTLAEKIGVTQSKISKYELAMLDVAETDLVRIAKVLGYPVEFFSVRAPLYGLTGYFYYRKRASLTVSEQKAIEAEANILRIRVSRLLRGVELDSPYQFPRLDVEKFAGGPAEIARGVRAAWSLPSGPIRNVVEAIESAGGIVFSRPFGTTQLDAVIQCPNGLPPLFFINSSMISGERQRFSLAHEIGHVVMRNVLSDNPEAEADQFAAEFLMPEREIAPQLDDLTIAKALRLKPYWKVSMQALIRRAYDLGKISPRKYRSLFADLSARGYRVNEPLPLPFEAPGLISDIIETHTNRMGLDERAMCKLLLSSDRDYRSQFLPAEGERRGFGVVG